MMRQQARQEALRAIRSLDVPAPFDLAAFQDRIESRRHRRLEFRELPSAFSALQICGLYVETPVTDLVFYPAKAAEVHRVHVIVHELMHLLLGHGRDGSGASLVSVADLLPDLDPALVRRVLGRSGYQSSEEEEAELTASLIMQNSTCSQGLTPVQRLDLLMD